MFNSEQKIDNLEWSIHFQHQSATSDLGKPSWTYVDVKHGVE